MGLIIATLSSTSVIKKEQYNEYYYCDPLSNDILLERGSRYDVLAGRKYPFDNTISDGCVIFVGENQALLIVENGKIIDFSMKEGVYLWSTKTTPGCFINDLPTELRTNIEEIAKKITYSGANDHKQEVFYVNIGDITNNTFGLGSPVTYCNPIYLKTYIEYFGMFSFKIINPITFFKTISSQESKPYTTNTLLSLCLNEFYASLDVLLSDDSIPLEYSEVPCKHDKLSMKMEIALYDKWFIKRGFQITSVAISKVATKNNEQVEMDAHEKEIFRYLDSKFSDEQPPSTQTIIAATKEEMKVPSNPPFQDKVLNNNPFSNTLVEKNEVMLQKEMWICPNCQNQNTGNFCSECGTKKPEEKKPRFCSECGTRITTEKFCPNCGTKI